MFKEESISWSFWHSLKTPFQKDRMWHISLLKKKFIMSLFNGKNEIIMQNLHWSRFHFCTRKLYTFCGNKHVQEYLWLAKHVFKPISKELAQAFSVFYSWPENVNCTVRTCHGDLAQTAAFLGPDNSDHFSDWYPLREFQKEPRIHLRKYTIRKYTITAVNI